MRSNLARDFSEGDPLSGVFTETWRRAVVAEISWVTAGGPRGVPVVPLLHRGQPAAALPYSQFDDAQQLIGATAVFTVTDLTAGSRTALAARGRVEVTHDPEGEVFIGEELLIQEVIKHPPTKLRSDSLMARRENAWWTPRILVTLPVVEEELAIDGRTRPHDGLLVTGTPATPQVTTVTAEHWGAGEGDIVDVYGRHGTDPIGSGDAALIWAHQFTPDFERWDRWYRAGRLRGTTLTITDVAGAPVETPRPLTLIERLTTYRAAARECRRGLAAAGHDG